MQFFHGSSQLLFSLLLLLLLFMSVNILLVFFFFLSLFFFVFSLYVSFVVRSIVLYTKHSSVYLYLKLLRGVWALCFASTLVFVQLFAWAHNVSGLVKTNVFYRSTAEERWRSEKKTTTVDECQTG